MAHVRFRTGTDMLAVSFWLSCEESLKVLAVAALKKRLRELLELVGVNPAVVPGCLLRAADLDALTCVQDP